MRIRWRWVPALLLLAGCSGVPKGLQPATGFDVQKYLGRWKEIARLDHGFERGLSDVTADYRKLPDDRIGVINRGFDARNYRWKEAKGVARFQGSRDVGSLEVSFFGPFYGAYNVLVLDPQYRYALVAITCGYSRDRQFDAGMLAELVGRAREWGFATDKLIYVAHTHIQAG